MDLGLKDRVVLVTGASRGIGREIALACAREGACIAVNFLRNERAAEKCVTMTARSGVDVSSFQADVTCREEAAALIARVIARFGRLDVLVHNAGIVIEGEETMESWEKTLDSHLNSTFYLCAAVVPHMKSQRFGRIIAIGSLAARVPGAASYSVAKAAQSHYVRGLARELGPYNITCNVVSPGRINTEMVPGTPEERRSYARSNIPLYRERDDFPGPELIGDIVAFLASDRAVYISGADIHASGGAYTGL